MFGDAAQINLDGTKVLVSALVPFSEDITEVPSGCPSLLPFFFDLPLPYFEMMKLGWGSIQPGSWLAWTLDSL